ncbi:MAG: fumarate hydratase [Deltaproteobacteria bacterium CG12_big_fil_rev_8_21_14_0_65_43_10]|nr:MAG: fumarate hydratase [Deltaproteobacteria bacterium CG2_30_43_15]PIQ46210.1 MAG: fumarate hydratase [Deltaproteobacteria bacterium CG12_big_fil_rev_8_21_14_0_65_43_10]PIU86294.1 MAG: fumarate hydratase [Deltaproteobacteria bacterium CG06_land_8_20_14_3_00_44_19]PIX21905.1 MAG: fumarate hydratase [Deltaproteobacteria bacterium CG_4_8_14_3_um_filter_43_13]PIZ20300.1 MAG: fumarate hydratase [Deltaproteobacteria bacterium CG_4_10_14_0_8_um_filter_43_12]PJB44788.1 MAG: fumarate hydratase [Del
MREIEASYISEKVKELCMEANYDLPEDVLLAFQEAKEAEESPLGVSILEQLQRNAEIARNERVPICQDTGFGVVFVELGEDVKISGGSLKEAVTEGVRQGYGEGYLRKSICHPFTRKNTGDNTPPIIHIDLVQGEELKIIVAPKGGGSENMSRVTMLKPSDGIEGIIDFVVNRVKESGGNPCPPIIVGVGIGGTFEYAALLAKKALLRHVGSSNADPELAGLEKDILNKINDLGIGPMGLGGRTTALAVHIEMYPCHIASLPLAVNINCHASRHKEISL